MAKDWTGNYNSVFKTLGSSHHTDHDRQPYDYYATEPRAALLLLEVEQFHHDIWECACGEKHLANVFAQAGYNVRCSDIVNRCDNEVLDFLDITNTHWQGDIITNPPYKYAREFVEKALSIIPDDGCKYAYSDDTEACRSIADDIEHCIKNMCDIHYRIKIDIITIEEKTMSNYNTDIAHCFGNNCPLRGQCRRFELYVIWEKAELNNNAFFTVEQYDKKNKSM